MTMKRNWLGGALAAVVLACVTASSVMKPSPSPGVDAGCPEPVEILTPWGNSPEKDGGRSPCERAMESFECEVRRTGACRDDSDCVPTRMGDTPYECTGVNAAWWEGAAPQWKRRVYRCFRAFYSSPSCCPVRCVGGRCTSLEWLDDFRRYCPNGRSCPPGSECWYPPPGNDCWYAQGGGVCIVTGTPDAGG